MHHPYRSQPGAATCRIRHAPETPSKTCVIHRTECVSEFKCASSRRREENLTESRITAGTGFHYLKGQLMFLLPRAYRRMLVLTQPRNLCFLIGAKPPAIITSSSSRQMTSISHYSSTFNWILNLICVGYLQLLIFCSGLNMAALDVQFTTDSDERWWSSCCSNGRQPTMTSVTLREKYPSYWTVKNWVARL